MRYAAEECYSLAITLLDPDAIVIDDVHFIGAPRWAEFARGVDDEAGADVSRRCAGEQAQKPEARNGDIVVPRIGQEVTLKRYERVDARRVELQPVSTNPEHRATLARMSPAACGAGEGPGCRAPAPDANPRRDMAHRPLRSASQKPGLPACGGRYGAEHHHRAALRRIERARTEEHRPDPDDRNCTTARADSHPAACVDGARR